MNLKRYGAQTHQGSFITNNEDSFHLDFVNNLFMIFDGFGGAGIGDVAVKKLIDDVSYYYLHFAGDPDATQPFTPNPKYSADANALMNSCLVAHQNLWEINTKLPLNKRAGASGLVLNHSGSILSVFATGNLMMIRIPSQGLNDSAHHTLVSPDSYRHLAYVDKSPYTSFPMSAYGLYQKLDYQFLEFRIHPGDRFLCLSDGVYNYLGEQDYLTALSPKKDLKSTIAQLLKYAIQRGSRDNMSVLILEY